MGKRFIHDFYNKISIKTKLMFIAVLFIVYPILIIGYFGYRNYADVMKEKAISNSQTSVLELSGQLSERMQRLNLFSAQIFYDRKIYDAYNKLSSGLMDSFSESDFQQYLQSILFSKYELTEILVRFKIDDKEFQVSRSWVSNTGSHNDFGDIYRSALKGKGSPVWYVSQKDGVVSGIYLAKIIYDTQDVKKETGVIIFRVDEQYLFEIFNNFISHMKQNITLFSADNQMVFVSNAFEMSSQKPVEDILTSGRDSSVQEVSVKGDTLYLLYDTIQPAGWKLVIGISANLLFKEVRSILGFTLLLCAATLPICLLLVNYLYNDIIKPMNLLIRRMRQIEKGEIGVTIEKERKDEFGYVFNTFNKMSQNIKNLIDTVYKKQIAMKDAELKALQAQINPHFLYNTLEAINWKAKIHGVEEISEMVSALSCITEANLDRKNEKYIPVRNEIDYIKSYNFLIQKRFGKKIKFNMTVEDDVLDLIIPKLIVQPLIENAIYHGLEMKKGGGVIEIDIRRDNSMLVATVADNGLGIEADILKRIQDDLNDETYLDDVSKNIDVSKIGVLNVHRRIRLLHGDDYGLSISSSAGVGTTVVVKLPVISVTNTVEKGV